MSTTTVSAGSRFPRLSPTVRKAVLVTHIVTSVGLLGDSLGFLAVALRASTLEDAQTAHATYEVLELFSIAFGIPLTLAALATGIVLGLGTPWGVFRHRWVTAKLALQLSVLACGALVLGPGIATALEGDDAEARIIAGAAWQVGALTLATGLSVFKPGRRRARPARG